MPATVVNGNSSCVIQFFSRISSGSTPDLGGELVHDPLDGEGRLGPAGAAVGVDPGLVGEHRLAVELVGRELVDRVEHARAEHRHAAADEREVGAHVGEQLDLEAR